MKISSLILNMSLTATLILPLILVLRFFVRKVSKRLAFLLWIIPALRLVIPFAPVMPFSLIPGGDISSAVKEISLSEPQKTTVEDSHDSKHQQTDAYSMSVSKQSDPSANTDPVKPQPASDMTFSDEVQKAPYRNVPLNDSSRSAVISSESATKEMLRESGVKSTDKPASYYISVIWALGFLTLLIFSFTSYIKLRKKLQVSVKVQPGIYLADGIDTAFILGIMKPLIYLPSTGHEDDFIYMLTHEKAHIKRRDHLTKMIGFLILSIHWFNPVIWGAYILFCHDMEMACDETVLSSRSYRFRKGYAEALLNFSSGNRSPLLSPLSFAEDNVSSRIKAAATYKKPSKKALVFCMIILLTAAGCLNTNQKDIVIPITSKENTVPDMGSNEEKHESESATDRTNDPESGNDAAESTAPSEREAAPEEFLKPYSIKNAALYLENADQVVYVPEYTLTCYLGRSGEERIFTALNSKDKVVLMAIREDTGDFREISDLSFIQNSPSGIPEVYPGISDGQIFLYDIANADHIYKINIRDGSSEVLLKDTGCHNIRIKDIHNGQLLLQFTSEQNISHWSLGIFAIQTNELEILDFDDEKNATLDPVMLDDGGIWYEKWEENRYDFSLKLMYYDLNTGEHISCQQMPEENGPDHNDPDYPSALPFSGIRDSYLYAIVDNRFAQNYTMIQNGRCIVSGHGTLYITDPGKAVIHRIRVEALNDPLNWPVPLWYPEDPEEISLIFGGRLYLFTVPSLLTDDIDLEALWRAASDQASDPDTQQNSEQNPEFLKVLYPEYFSYDLSRGLSILVTPVSKDQYTCRLMSGTLSRTPLNELLPLPQINPENMKTILSSLDPGNTTIILRLFRSPDTTYMIPYESPEEVESCHAAISKLFDDQYLVLSQMIGTSPKID